MKKGTVYLVGAGPGDPGLATVRCMELLSRCDAVVYDYLANPALLSGVRRDAEMIYVGKKGGDHTLSQDEINRLIVRLAEEGKDVVRLKGGDPYIFGRGGEEAEELSAAGAAFEVVPGVSSAAAAPACAGIPLTHRDHTSNVGLVTGHEDPTKPESSLDWGKFAAGFGTLVFVMGVKNLARIADNLVGAGRSPDTPAALIRWGTTPDQRTVTGTLADIAVRADEAGIRPPAVLVVGGVVSLRDKLNWFERRPLFGRRIMVTRTREQASRLSRGLAEHGAAVIECPTIEIHDPEDRTPLDEALARIGEYDWLVLTSPNGVDRVWARMREGGMDARALAGVRLAAIGPATADRLAGIGLEADLLPEKYVAEGLIEALLDAGVEGSRILLARAAEARDVLPRELAAAGAHVTEAAAYRTLPPDELTPHARRALDEGAVDLVTFTSSSTAENLARLLGSGLEDFRSRVRAASIGPITSAAARELGFHVAVEAEEYTVPGLIDAVVRHFSS